MAIHPGKIVQCELIFVCLFVFVSSKKQAEKRCFDSKRFFARSGTGGTPGDASAVHTVGTAPRPEPHRADSRADRGSSLILYRPRSDSRRMSSETPDEGSERTQQQQFAAALAEFGRTLQGVAGRLEALDSKVTAITESLHDVVAQEVHERMEEFGSRRPGGMANDEAKERRQLMENEAYRRHILLRCGVPPTLPVRSTGAARVSKLHDVLVEVQLHVDQKVANMLWEMSGLQPTAFTFRDPFTRGQLHKSERSFRTLVTGFKLMKAAIHKIIGLGLDEMPGGSQALVAELTAGEDLLEKFDLMVVQQGGVVPAAELTLIESAIHEDLDRWTGSLDAVATHILQSSASRMAPLLGSGEVMEVPVIPDLKWTSTSHNLNVSGDIAGRVRSAESTRKRQLDGAFPTARAETRLIGAGAGAGRGQQGQPRPGGSLARQPVGCPRGVCWVWWRHTKEGHPNACLHNPCGHRHSDT